MSEKNRCTVCGETLELNGLNKAVQDVVNGLGGLEGLFELHVTEQNYSHNDIDGHIDGDEITTTTDVQGVSVGGDFSGEVGNMLHGSTQKCVHNHNLDELSEKSHDSLTNKGVKTHDELDACVSEEGIELNPSPIANLTANGIKMKFITAENLVFGDIVGIGGDVDDGKMRKQDLGSFLSNTVMGMALETINANNEGLFLIYGFVRNDVWNWVRGKTMMADKVVPGTMSQEDPFNYNARLGVAIKTNVILFNPCYKESWSGV